MVPVIDVFKCDGCKICVKQCPPQVMGIVRERAVILADLCEECGICVDVCPVGAVQFKLPTRGGDSLHEAYRTHQ